MNHLSDKQLERWLRSKRHLDRDKAIYISEHLEMCNFCREKLALLKAYNKDIDRELNRNPNEREKAIASRIYRQKTPNALAEESLNIKKRQQHLLEASAKSLPAKLKNHLQKYPLTTASATAGVVLIAAVLLIIQPWHQIHNNPTFAEVKRNVLQVYNQDGKPIWHKVANGIPNDANSKTGPITSSQKYIQIADIDGNGKNEVLLTGKNNGGKFTKSALYCFNTDGTLRWKQQPPAPILFGERTHSKMATWDIRDFFVFNTSGNDHRLFITANSSWFPSVLFELNPLNGQLLHTYWHPGWIWTSKIYKNKDSGRSFILLGTTNDTYRKAALAVLDPDNIDGYAPMRDSYKPKKGSAAHQKRYIMFQPSRLNRRYSHQMYNQTSQISITGDGGLLVRVVEKWENIHTNGAVFYTLNKNFTVLEAHGSKTFDKAYFDLFKAGKLDAPLTSQYWKRLKDSVLYWSKTKSQFISQEQLKK